MSTISRGKSAKTARGQEGETAQAVWAKHGLKNWAKRLDGTLVEQAEYDKIRIGLWKDYYNLLGFCDQANFAWAGTGHRCLPGNTLIKCEGNRLVPLEKINVGDMVSNGLGGFSRVSNFWQTGIKKSITITTRSGLKIKTSLDHKFLASQQRNLSQFVVASDLLVGDYLSVDRSEFNCHDVMTLPPVSYSRKSSELQLTVPTSMNEELAWVLGALIGDGAVCDMAEGRVDFTSDLKDMPVHQKMMDFAKSVGLNPKERLSVEGNASISLYWYSKPFRSWLHSLGLLPNKSSTKEVPWSILQSPPHIQSAFLRGLFDTDGSVSAKMGRIVLVTTSEILHDQVKIMLLNCGIISMTERRKPSANLKAGIIGKHPSFVVCVTGYSACKFQDQIGFEGSRKTELLSQIVPSPQGKTNVDYIPFGWHLIAAFKELISPAKRNQPKASNSKERRRVQTIVRGVQTQSHKLNHSHIGLMREFLSGENKRSPELENEASLWHFYDCIVSIKESEECLMYDIEVDRDHQFVANGFVVHNCQGSTLDVVIIDIQNMTRDMKWMEIGSDEQASALYTAATRAKTQVVIME